MSCSIMGDGQVGAGKGQAWSRYSRLRLGVHSGDFQRFVHTDGPSAENASLYPVLADSIRRQGDGIPQRCAAEGVRKVNGRYAACMTLGYLYSVLCSVGWLSLNLLGILLCSVLIRCAILLKLLQMSKHVFVSYLHEMAGISLRDNGKNIGSPSTKLTEPSWFSSSCTGLWARQLRKFDSYSRLHFKDSQSMYLFTHTFWAILLTIISFRPKDFLL